MKKVLFILNDASFFISHRLDIAINAKNQGYDVTIATAPSEAVKSIVAAGLRHKAVPFSRSGQNPFMELVTLWQIFMLLMRNKPDLVHLVTIKPVLYGAILARITGIKNVVAAVSGLGTVFVSNSLLGKLRLKLVKALYTTAFRHKNLNVIFQNPDDRDALIELTNLPLAKSSLIRGSGVSLIDYPYSAEPKGDVAVVMAARLLVDKGVYEFVESARILRDRGINVEFRLIGSIDTGNKTSISQCQFDDWKDNGPVTMLGYRQDIAQQYTNAHIVCLPSYREGLPKGLIEAAACGRAVVTTNVPGCRDAITPDVTGLLVPVKDSVALADAIEYLVKNPSVRQEMGKAGRKLAEAEFTIEHVVEEHMKIYKELLLSA